MSGRRTIKGFLAVALASAMAVGLSGCVLVISDEGIESHGPNHKRSSRADGRLADRVFDALAADPLLEHSDIEVSANGGVVTLRGTLEGTERFERAVQLARATEGVERVVSRIKVEVQ